MTKVIIITFSVACLLSSCVTVRYLTPEGEASAYQEAKACNEREQELTKTLKEALDHIERLEKCN